MQSKILDKDDLKAFFSKLHEVYDFYLLISLIII